jgi:hypothetical protein
MHISLDSALGQQRRLNQVGETISSIAAPTAAYSLRSLTGGDPKVVRVRRESDNNERDFTASEVSSGALVDFVNTQVTAPLDIQALTATGRDGDFLIAKAAYSLRSLGTRQATVTSSGDTDGDTSGKFVCQVRSVTGDIKSFTADEVSDGTLVDFVLGNTKSLLNSRAYFDGSNDEVDLTSDIDLTGDFSIQFSLVVTVKNQRMLGKKSVIFLAASGNNEIESFKGNLATSGFTLNLTSNLKYGEEHTVKFKRVSGKIGMYNESDTLISNEITTSETFTVNSFGKARGQFGKGVIHSIRIDTNGNGTINHSYNGYGNTLSDWQDLVGSNNASAVNGSPALFTGQDQDGFVKTWYDQSVTTQAGDTATGNHVTQATAANQPKIVSSGSLLNELVFDGSDDFLQTTANFDAFGSNSLAFFTVMNPSDLSGNPRFLNTRSATPGIEFVSTTNPRLYYKDSGGTGTNGDTQSASLSTGTEVLYTNLVDKDTDQIVEAFKNGSSVTISSPTDLSSVGSVNAAELTIGANNSGGNLYNGKTKEIIIYASDQTDNRTAIEANMGEHYSISGIPAFDNSVNGFVETWYDQSGNSLDAVQATAAEQPKIVDAGSLLPAGVTFDGGDTLSVSGEPVITASSSGVFSAFSVQTVATNEAGYMYGNAASPNGASVYALSSSKFALTNKTSINFDNIPRSSGQNLLSAVYNNGDAGLLVNGAGTMTDAGTYDFSAGTGDFVIGNRNGGSAAATFLIGSINEIIIYNSNQSSNRTALETEIISHYGIS